MPPTNLYQYYTSKGQTLPSVEQRKAIWNQLTGNPAGIYAGTAEQNNVLLAALMKQGNTPATPTPAANPAPAPAPAPVTISRPTPTPAQPTTIPGLSDYDTQLKSLESSVAAN